MKYARAIPPPGRPMDRKDDLSPDERLAEQLVDEALRTMAIPPVLLPAIRATLIAELLVTVQGRRLLRQVKPDPQVSASDDVPVGGAGEPAARRVLPNKGGKLP